MDTPKREVSWLEHFPPDIWAYIVCYLPGEQLGRLMMTGATFLSRLLKSPTVVKYISLGEDFIVFRSLQGFLNNFPSLEELLIHSYHGQSSAQIGWNIESIPSGVRKLELSGGWEDCADQLFGESGSTLKLSEHLPHLQHLDLWWVKLANYSWMTHSPQSLTSLGLDHWDGTVELPSSLIHFAAYGIALSATSFVSKLPPFLESFVISDVLDGVDLVVPLLPPSTRKLSLGEEAIHSDGPRSSQSLLGQLPKSLTWLQIPRASELDFVANPELASLLPAKLTALQNFTMLPCSAWHLLPQQTTKLVSRASMFRSPTVVSIANDQTLSETKTIPFESLPRSITSLELFSTDQYFCGPPDISNRSFFPPQLTDLRIQDIQLSPETAQLLPSSLTHLEIGNLCERVCEHLPAGLKTLIPIRTLMSPSFFKFLPRSLTFLELPIPNAEDPWFDYSTYKRIDSITQLSEYPNHERCLSKSFDWGYSSPLPPTLTYFFLNNATELGDSFMLHQQLPNLLELNMNTSLHITDLSIPLLSPHLRTLDLQSSSKISSKSFQFLPRCLTYLNLDESELILDSDVQYLPRTLKSAYFNSAIHLTESCISDLPQHLKKLFVSKNSQIPPSSFPKFPYSLRCPQHHLTVLFANWHIEQGVVQER